MRIKNEYPCIINRSQIAPKDYIGIMYNGDQGVYRKATVKALKKAGTSKECIKAVRAADGDLEISKILIEADLFDILVDVFNLSDSRTAVFDYIDNLYLSIVDEAEVEFANFEIDFSKTVSQLGENPDISKVLSKVDGEIQNRTEVLCEKLEDIHQTTARTILEKFQEACKRKLAKLKKELQEVQEEKRRLEKML